MARLPGRNALIAIAITLSIAVGVAGCGNSESSGGSAASTNGGETATPAPGGELKIVRSGETATLDPAQGYTPEDIAPIDQIFSRLYEVGQDGKLEPSLAASATTSDGGRTLQIKLQEGVTFSSGKPLTAADVKYSLDRSRNSDGGFSFLLGGIASVAAPDPDTVVINTAKPDATLEAALSAWVASIVPKGLEGKSEKAFFEHPVGSGPFMFGSWTKGSSIKLVKNPTYWKQGQPLLESVTWNRVPDANTRVAQVQSGQADVAGEVPFSQLSSLGERAGFEAESFPSNDTSFLIFNQEVKPLGDIHVRRAIAYALNKAALTEATLFGAGTPACSMVPPTMPFSDPKTPCLEFDLAMAKAEMSKSSASGGFSAELTIDNEPISASIAQIVQSALEEIGIKLKIKTVDSGQLYTVYENEAFEVGLARWVSDIPEPDEQLSFMLNPEAGGNAYYTGYDNPKVNSLLAEGRETLTPAARTPIYAQIQAIAAEEVPQVPLSNQGDPYLWSEAVTGFHVNPMGTIGLAEVGKAG